jgi:5-methylcytosine-specific restriction endonuclease McrA
MPNRPGRPTVPRILVSCKYCGIGVPKTEKEAARIAAAACRDCRAVRSSVPWSCRVCGIRKTLPASLASHISRCEGCRPATLRPMRQVTGVCEGCGKEFSGRFAADRLVRFCGDACRLAWFSTAFTGPSSPQWIDGSSLRYGIHWKAVRKAVYARDGYRCRSCATSRSKRNPLVAAHLTPRRGFEPAFQTADISDHPANLVALCVPCHIGFDRSPQTRWDYDLGDRGHWPEWTAQRVADQVDWAKRMVAAIKPECPF